LGKHLTTYDWLLIPEAGHAVAWGNRPDGFQPAFSHSCASISGDGLAPTRNRRQPLDAQQNGMAKPDATASASSRHAGHLGRPLGSLLAPSDDDCGKVRRSKRIGRRRNFEGANGCELLGRPLANRWPPTLWFTRCCDQTVGAPNEPPRVA